MRKLRKLLGLALLAIVVGCKPSSDPVVRVSKDVPASLRQSVLKVTTVMPEQGTSYGSRSLASPVGSGSSSDNGQNRRFHEMRLLAIDSTGFRMRLTIGKQDQPTQRATIFFPFGKVTETTVLNCKVVGRFE